jgi:hypothetical protein
LGEGCWRWLYHTEESRLRVHIPHRARERDRLLDVLRAADLNDRVLDSPQRDVINPMRFAFSERMMKLLCNTRIAEP